MKRIELTDAFLTAPVAATYGTAKRYLDDGWYILTVDEVTTPTVVNGVERQRIIFKEENTGLTVPYFHTSGAENDSDLWKVKNSVPVVAAIVQAAGVQWTGVERANCQAPSALVGRKIYALLTTKETKKTTVDPVTMQNVERVFINNDFSKEGRLCDVIKPVAASQTTTAVESDFNFSFNA